MVRPTNQKTELEKFASIEKTVLAQEIVRNILSLIQAGKLQPYEKLPPERELASALQVSRPPLREALRALQLMNVIEIRPGAGAYVSPLGPKQLAQPLRLLLLLQDATYLEILEARRTIEPAITALAAERIADKHLTQLNLCLSKAQESIGDPSAFMRVDLELHSIIAEASCNPLLMSIMASINHLGIATRQRTANLPGVPEMALKHHAIIVEALRQRDPKASWEAMEKHISDIEHTLRKAALDTEALEDLNATELLSEEGLLKELLQTIG